VLAPAQADQRWQNTVWMLADNNHPDQHRNRNWQELNPQEQQRIYQRYQQFQGWPTEEQKRVCQDYTRKTGSVAEVCRKKFR